jgi:hypothetical protein
MAWERDVSITTEVLRVYGKTARIKANLSGLTRNRIEIHIDATKFTANGGRAKLNADEDKTSGEEFEDDVNEYLIDIQYRKPDGAKPATWATPPANGNNREPRSGVTLKNVNFDTTLTTGNGLYNQVKFTVENYAASEDSTIRSFFKENLKIEKYVDGTWTPIDFTVDHLLTYDADDWTRTYVASFATAADRDILRVRLEKFRTFETENKYFGYRQKLIYDGKKGWLDTDPDTLVLVSPTFSLDETRTVTVTPPLNARANYTEGSIAASDATLLSDTANRNVYVRIPLETGDLNAQNDVPPIVGTGELTGVSNETVKIVAKSKYSTSPDLYTFVKIEWEEENISYEYKVETFTAADGTESSVKVPSALLLKLPESFEKSDRSWFVLITPGVKTSSGKAAYPEDVYFYSGVYTGLADKVDGTGTL